MRIAIIGSACQGKTTLVNDMIKTWPNYKAHVSGYRKLIKDENLPINKEMTQAAQWAILNCLIDDLQSYTGDDDIIFDRCPLDNIVYSLWSNAKSTSDIDDEFIKKCIPLIQQSMHLLDIIFFLPITKTAPVEITEKDQREISPEFIEEIDNIFKSISHSYYRTGKSPFFPEEDRPPIIEIFGNPAERIEMMKLYLNEEGKVLDGDSIFSAESIKDMEDLLGIQAELGIESKKEKDLRKDVIRTKLN
jgi:hypothetical protein